MIWVWLRSELAPTARVANNNAPWRLVVQAFDDHVAWQAQAVTLDDADNVVVMTQGTINLPYVFTDTHIATAMQQAMGFAEHAAESLMTEPARKVA